MTFTKKEKKHLLEKVGADYVSLNPLDALNYVWRYNLSRLPKGTAKQRNDELFHAVKFGMLVVD